jgi:hypothetical protein
MPSVVSTAPACIDALVTLMRAVLPQEGDDAVRVFDGGPVRESEVTDDVVCIGYSPEDDSVVTDTRTVEQMESSPDTERYDITGLASSWQGGKIDAKTVRDRAYGLVDMLAAQLAADQTLGGVVMRARVSSTSLGQSQTSKGATATVTYTISVLASTR